MNEIERVEELMKDPEAVFVFGANLRGIHGGGAAKTALKYYGATWNHIGLMGRSYGLPTCDYPGHALPFDRVQEFVRIFLAVARGQPTRKFILTKVGCGIAGFEEDQMIPLFSDAPENVIKPEGW